MGVASNVVLCRGPRQRLMKRGDFGPWGTNTGLGVDTL